MLYYSKWSVPLQKQTNSNGRICSKMNSNTVFPLKPKLSVYPIDNNSFPIIRNCGAMHPRWTSGSFNWKFYSMQRTAVIYDRGKWHVLKYTHGLERKHQSGGKRWKFTDRIMKPQINLRHILSCTALHGSRVRYSYRFVLGVAY